MKRGFTLIELIVVIAIIAVLAAIVAPNAFKAIEKGKVSATVSDYKSIKTAAMAYYSDIGSWPSNTTNGAGFVNNTSVPSASIDSWDGPYLDKWPAKAQWGGSYAFNSSSDYNWDGSTGNDQARYVTISNIPTSGSGSGTAGKIDIQLDGASNRTSGSIQYDTPVNSTTTMRLLVSYD